MTSWQLLDDYFWGWPQLGQPKNRKALCEKNNGIPEAQEIGKKSFVRKSMVHYTLDCMHGLFYQTKLRKMSGALSWYFFLSNLRLLEGMGLALRPKAISRNTIYICYNFQNEIIFQKDRKNRPIKNVFRFWISDCIKLKYSSVNNIIMESKLLWSQVDILIHPDFILRIIRTVERMPLLDLGISLKSNYRISLNNE